MWQDPAALVITVGGAAVLTEARFYGQPRGFVLAFANCAGFMLYVMLAHHAAGTTVAASSDGQRPG